MNIQASDYIDILMSELNSGADLCYEEILLYLPETKMIKVRKSGDCETCNAWDSSLEEGMCYVCRKRYLV